MRVIFDCNELGQAELVDPPLTDLDHDTLNAIALTMVDLHRRLENGPEDDS